MDQPKKIPGAHDDLSVSQAVREAADAAPAQKLPDSVEKVIDDWRGTMLQSIGPKVSPIAYTEIAESTNVLKRQIAATLGSFKQGD